MFRLGTRHKTIHIHVGPHKTGSTAIQHALRDHEKEIREKLGITFLNHECIQAFAKAVNHDDETAIEAELKKLVKLCAKARGDVLISCEDLSGNLPGRGNVKRVYATLWPNLNRLRRALSQHDVKFYFFVRDPEKWLRSAYAQLLKFRSRFKSYEGFSNFMRDLDHVWDATLERTRDRLGERFIEIPYREDADFSAAKVFFETAFGAGAGEILPTETTRHNASPEPEIVRMLEHANRSGASFEAILAAKNCYMQPVAASQYDGAATTRPAWPPVREKPAWLSPNLEALWKRVTWRASKETQSNLMPDPHSDLTDYRHRIIQVGDELPDIGRERMEDQAVILRHRLKGAPETCYLLGLAISYLRRHTGHEDHASLLFQRLWADEHPILLGFLPTRWLISTFQTFMDHGVTEHQRTIGTAAFFLTNTLKMYEAERALEGMPTDSTYANTTPVTKAGFWGLDRYGVGGTDMLLNTNALFLELAAREPLAGRVVQEFLLRVKRYDTAFSRMDDSRIAHQIDKPPFSDCWSFFEPPDKDRKRG
ncbi:MAG: hypothetical protein AAF557_16050 [Pseudomonadota bacterium]